MDHLTVATYSHKLSLWIEQIQECRASNQKTPRAKGKAVKGSPS